MTESTIVLARRAGAVFPEDGSYHRFESEDSLESFVELIKAKERERIANQIDRMPFGDTAASFAIWIRAGAP
jgi:hypothetical protein